MTTLVPITLSRMADPRHGPELTAFAENLQRQHYASLVIDMYVRHLARALPRMEGLHQTRGQILCAFLLPQKPKREHKYLAAAATVYCRYLGSRGRLMPDPDHGTYAALRRDYAHFLVEMRGLSLSSREHHAAVVCDLLQRALTPGQPLQTLTALQVENFVMLRSREISRHSLQHDVAYVRAFLRYCHDHGHIPNRLDRVETVRTYRGELPPKAMPWPDVLKLLAGVDRGTVRGIRDFTMLHLLAYYGLRPSEIALLQPGSIDWQGRLLHVTQCKTKSRLVLPLSEETLAILRRYLVQCRARIIDEHPGLFLRVVNPVGPISRHAICDAFDLHARNAGFKDAGHSVYSLRHAFAMRLLARGVGVKAIGDVLGHRSIETTCTYLRLDMEVLRCVALEVPSVDAAKGVCHV